MTVDITPQTIKKLREKTGAGMMNCKQALTENNGDFEKAVEFRELGKFSLDGNKLQMLKNLIKKLKSLYHEKQSLEVLHIVI